MTERKEYKQSERFTISRNSKNNPQTAAPKQQHHYLSQCLMDGQQTVLQYKLIKCFSLGHVPKIWEWQYIALPFKTNEFIKMYESSFWCWSTQELLHYCKICALKWGICTDLFLFVFILLIFKNLSLMCSALNWCHFDSILIKCCFVL